jgi:hypothetical protein
VGARWTVQGKPGWEIEAIRLDGRDTIRVRHHGVLVAYCSSGVELERVLGRHGITLADLVEVPEPDRG